MTGAELRLSVGMSKKPWIWPAWRSRVRTRLAPATVMGMVALGAEPAPIRAAIGPTISAANYEVGPDTAAQIVALDKSAASHVAIPDGKDREHFDIPGLLAEQLFGAGVGLVSNLDICTYANPAKYFSHRYATHHGVGTGRQIAVIGMR